MDTGLDIWHGWHTYDSALIILLNIVVQQNMSRLSLLEVFVGGGGARGGYVWVFYCI